MTVPIERPLARRIIETVGAYGAPPEWGFQLFSAGIGPYLDVLDKDYLGDFIAGGGASFKLVVGAYGGGKTHFLYSVRELAWRHRYAVAYVPLSAEESPLHRLELVYRAIVQSLTPPLEPEELFRGAERGFDAFLKSWLAETRARLAAEGLTGTELKAALLAEAGRSLDEVESVNFCQAVRHLVEALVEGRDDDALNVLQWITVQGYDRMTHKQYGILHPVDRSHAFSMIRSLVRWVRNLGYTGLAILFDEAEQVPSLSSKQREIMLSNLREIVDECGHAAFRNVLILYAIPDMGFFEGRSNVYEALKQRISTVFDFVNPTGVRIDLERVMGGEPVALLREIGQRLADIFQAAFAVTLAEDRVALALRLVAEAAYEQRFGDIGYKRVFVQGAVRALHSLRALPDLRPDEAWAAGIVAGAPA
ncbi:MAG: hypothetical protein AMXMBFR64_44750 [Myxococcales bacterium]